MKTKIFIRGVLIITAKNIKIYYNKPPVIIFGVLFPLFLFLAFYLGRQIDFYYFFPGLLAMSLFFTSSSVGPLITPWEKQAGTYQRLLSYPVTINTIIVGDILSGMIFGIVINIFVAAAGIIFLGYSLHYPLFFLALFFASFSFSALGVLLASPAVRAPSQVMMSSSLVRFPLIFISGIFIPLDELGSAGRTIASFSPVTYLVDLFNYAFVGKIIMPLILSFFALFAFSLIFLFAANKLHQKNHMKGL